MPNSLYIHIPFCRSKCSYCDFYSIAFDEKLAAYYLDTIINQIANLDERLDTVFIGGGTPTVIGKKLMEKLLLSLKDKLSGDYEFTVEANPESFDKDMARLLKMHKVNRISLGLQSLCSVKLKKLGRVHSVAQGLRSLDLAINSGFNNVNADFIFGIWGEDLVSWKKELEEIAKLALTHISCYSLSYEKGTRLFKSAQKQKIMPSDESDVSKMLRYAIDYLPSKGFEHYEVSNYAKDGFCCRHNLNYWDNNSYRAFGASATYYIGGIRGKYTSSISDYIQNYAQAGIIPAKEEKLSKKKFASETAALKIRTKRGIDLRWYKDKTGYELWEFYKEAFRELGKKRLIKIKKDKYRRANVSLTKRGFLFADEVSSSFF
ncbi:MAG: radical SAM family heme chaperone HemW [Candidatus Omnitrophica bacterium]|nr:radical SAM family heme chaperone HemW [Candidatus Omnitrophota bacterium]